MALVHRCVCDRCGADEPARSDDSYPSPYWREPEGWALMFLRDAQRSFCRGCTDDLLDFIARGKAREA